MFFVSILGLLAKKPRKGSYFLYNGKNLTLFFTFSSLEMHLGTGMMVPCHLVNVIVLLPLQGPEAEAALHAL